MRTRPKQRVRNQLGSLGKPGAIAHHADTVWQRVLANLSPAYLKPKCAVRVALSHATMASAPERLSKTSYMGAVRVERGGVSSSAALLAYL